MLLHHAEHESPFRSRPDPSPVAGERLRIGLLTDSLLSHPGPPARLCAALRAHGHKVAVIDAEASATNSAARVWLDWMELAVPYGRSASLLALLAAAEARQIPVVNRRGGISTAYRQPEMTLALMSAGLPTPPTFVGRLDAMHRRIPPECYPVVLSSLHGDDARGLVRVDTPDEMTELAEVKSMVLAQSHLEDAGERLDLCCIGPDVWAIRRADPLAVRERQDRASGSPPPAELLPLTPALSVLARRCAELFGLDLLEVRCVQTPGGLVVLGVDELPSFAGVPQAEERLADYIVRRGRDRRRPE